MERGGVHEQLFLPSHFQFGHEALFPSQHLELPEAIFFLYLFAYSPPPPNPTLTRMEAARHGASSVLLTTGIASAYNNTWTIKGNPQCVSSWLSDWTVRGQIVKLWALWLIKRDFIPNWVALFWVISSLCPALLPQHLNVRCNCWLTCLSLPSIAWGQEPSSSHLYVPGANHNDQQGEWASPWAPEWFFQHKCLRTYYLCVPRLFKQKAWLSAECLLMLFWRNICLWEDNFWQIRPSFC